MADQESAAMRNANRLFRKERQAKEGATAWKDLQEQENATRVKTEKLRAQRLARDAAATSVPAPMQKTVTRAAATKTRVR
jgi:hypothetical protein